MGSFYTTPKHAVQSWRAEKRDGGQCGPGRTLSDTRSLGSPPWVRAKEAALLVVTVARPTMIMVMLIVTVGVRVRMTMLVV